MTGSDGRAGARTPQVVASERAAAVSLGPDSGHLVRLITRSDMGADFLLGLAWLGPGRTMSFELADGIPDLIPPQEGYLLLSGRLRVTWGDPGAIEVGAGDAVYFPPGRSYIVESVGDVEAAVAYVAVPPPR